MLVVLLGLVTCRKQYRKRTSHFQSVATVDSDEELLKRAEEQQSLSAHLVVLVVLVCGDALDDP